MIVASCPRLKGRKTVTVAGPTSVRRSVDRKKKGRAVSSVDAIASGLPYHVLSVAGAPPATLDQFVGELGFIVDKGSVESAICGVGTRNADGVRFQEKDGPDGKDVRVWQIRQVAAGRVTAESLSAF